VNKAAVDKMVSLNIINGRDTGNFDPKGIVTRSEMIKMISVAMSGGVDPKLTTTVTSFTDTQNHWAAGYIEFGLNQGIVAGMGNKTFAPDQGVTGNQAAKMLLVALGYDATYENLTGPSWALSTMKIARQKGLFDDLGSIDANAPLTRDNAAQMVFNFCNANMVKYTFGISGSGSSISGVKQAEDIIIGNSNEKKYETILTKYYKLIDGTEGYLNGWTYDKEKKEYKYSINKNGMGTLATDVNTQYKTTQDFTGLFGMKVKLYYKDKNNNGSYDSNDDTIYDIAAKDSKKMLTGGVVGDWDTIKADDTDFTMNGTKYKLTGEAKDVKVYEFGKNADLGNAVHLDNYQDAIKVNPYTFDLIDNNGDGEADAIVVHPFTVKKITYVDSKGVTTDAKTYKFDDADIYKDAAKSDWAMITASDYSATKRDTLTKITLVTGEISSVKSASKIVIDGKTYENANGVTGDTTYKIGNKMELAVVNGYIFNAKKLTSTANKESVLLVIEADKVGTGTEKGTQKVSAVFSDGVKRTITVDEVNDYTVKDEGVAGTAEAGDHFLAYAGSQPVADKTIYAATYTLYSYNKDKDGNYELTPYNYAGNAKDYDNGYTAGAGTYFKDGKLVAGGSNSIRFDDDAVVFYYYKKTDGSTEYKVATGATVTKWAEIKDTKGMTGFAYTNEKDGFQYAQLAVLDMQNVVPSDDTTLYGYLTKGPELIKMGDDYYYLLKIWNGTTTDDFYAKGTDSQSTLGSSTKSMEDDANVAKGTPISYKAAGENAGKKIIDSVKSLQYTANAIVAYTDGKSFVGMQNKEKESSLKDLKITSDTKVIRFGSIKKETATGNGITIAKETTVGSGVYVNNCYVEAKTDGDIKVLIIDNDSSVSATGVTSTVTAAQADTQAKLTELFKAADTVEVTGAYAPTTAITIASGKTLKVTGAMTVNAAADSTITGTLDVTGAITGGAKLVVEGKLIAGNTLDDVKNVTSTGSVDATGAITNVTANAGTINATAAITTVAANTGTINAGTTIGEITSNAATGIINATGAITTVTANGGIINVKETLAIKTLPAAMAGTIVIDAGKTLTITDATDIATINKITGAAATAKLTLTAGSNTPYATATMNTFYTSAANGTEVADANLGAATSYTWKDSNTGLAGDQLAWVADV